MPKSRRLEFCSIISAKSGRCGENCRFCSQSIHYSGNSPVHGLLDDEAILDAARKAEEHGSVFFGLVTSGTTVSDAELETLCRVIGRIRESHKIAPCASLGWMDGSRCRQLMEAGLVRYHHNLETSERFYPQICTTHPWWRRVETVVAAKSAGLDVCSGGLFGLGETWKDREDLAETLRELGIMSVPLNFLDPRPGTPLGDRSPLSAEEAIEIVSLFRSRLPAATLRLCGGRKRILGNRDADAVRAGARGIMTGNYLTTSGYDAVRDRKMVRGLGMDVVETWK